MISLGYVGQYSCLEEIPLKCLRIMEHRVGKLLLNSPGRKFFVSYLQLFPSCIYEGKSSIRNLTSVTYREEEEIFLNGK